MVGPNGAGKTTLLSIVAGAQAASSGSVSGQAVAAGARRIGWAPQQPALYSKLTVRENLRLFARLEGVSDAGTAVAAMLEQTGLGERADERVQSLSGGNRQRVNVALGLLADPYVLALDEPSTALDPGQRARLWGFVGALARARDERAVLDASPRRGAPLCVAGDRAGRRRAAVRRGAEGVDARRGGRGRGRHGGGLCCVPCGAGAPMRALLRQGPVDPAPLAAARGRAGRLPDRDRAADRAGDIARPGQAEGGDRRSDAAGTDGAGGQREGAGEPLRRTALRPGAVGQGRDSREGRRGRRVGRGARGGRDPAEHRIATGLGLKQAQLEVLYNGNALEQSLVQSQIEAALAQANIGFSEQIQRAASQAIGALLSGRNLGVLGAPDLIGLGRSPPSSTASSRACPRAPIARRWNGSSRLRALPRRTSTWRRTCCRRSASRSRSRRR